MKKALHLYLKTKNAEDFIGKKDILKIAKDYILENGTEIDEKFLKTIEMVHDLIMDEHVPNYLKEDLLGYLQDLEEILQAHEDGHSDDDFDNIGFDLGESEEKPSEVKKSFLFKSKTMPEDQAKELQKTPFRPHYENVETKKLADGVYLHHSSKKTSMGNTSYLYHISFSENPKDLNSHIAQGSLLHFEQDKHPYPSVSSVKVKQGMEGRGIGKLLYHAMIKHHGGIMGDTVQSEADQRVWHSLGKNPNFDVKYAPEGNSDHNEGRHVLKVRKDFELEIPKSLIHKEE